MYCIIFLHSIKSNTQYISYSTGTKRPKVCQDNIPHTITPPTPPWTVNTRLDAFMLITPKSDPTIRMSKQKLRLIRHRFSNLPLCSFSEPVQMVAPVSCSLQTGRSTLCGLLLLPICFKVWRIVRSELVFFCIPWLYEWLFLVTFLSSWTCLAILTSELNTPRELPLTGYVLWKP